MVAWVMKCPIFQLVKAEHQVLSGLLQSLPILEWKLDHIIMDLVTDLPTSRFRYDAICVMLDSLTKSVFFLSIWKTNGIDRIAENYINEILQVHGVPMR